MKKTLFVLIAFAVAAVGCNKADVISVDRQAITFGNAFVDNATKADYSSGKALEQFKVWGTVTGNGNTLPLYGNDGATVTGQIGNDVWGCDKTEYWVPSCSYTFTAIADATDVKNMPSKVGYSVSSEGDLLLATATAVTNTNGTPSGESINTADGVVKFIFTHLLSKVFFKFSYGVTDNDRYAFAVKGISLSGLTATSNYVFSTGWEQGSGSETLTFGSPTSNVSKGVTQNSADSHQILPLEQTITATITYDVIYDGKTILAGQTQSATLNDFKFVGNTVYCLNIAMPAPGKPIQFRAESVGAFTEKPDTNLQ